jgi:hypothetical protein
MYNWRVGDAYSDSSHDIAEILLKLALNTNQPIIFRSVIDSWGCHGRDRMVIEFTTTCAISAYHY